MSATNSIDVSGLIRSTRTKGFTAQGSLNELIDNSLDASASVVRIDFDTASKTLYVSDDGLGMNKSKAKDCYKFHADKAASEKAGLYGIGKPVSEGVLSDLKSSTKTYTRAADDVVYEVEADWVVGEAEGTWTPVAARASVEGIRIWETRAINASHGTVVEVPMPEKKFLAMVSDVGTIAKKLAFTYQDYLEDDRVQIILSVDGALAALPTTENLGWNLVAEHQRLRRGIQVWKNGDDERVYHEERKDGRVSWVRLDLSKATPESAKRIADYAEVVAADSGWNQVGEFWLYSVYNPAWNPEGESFELGYTAFCRGRRYLAAIPAEPPTHGDFERRKVIGCARHALKYSFREDAYIRPEGNKSNVTRENIHPDLFKTVKVLARWWAAQYYSLYEEVPAVPDAPGRRATPAVKREFTALYETNDEWYREYVALCARYRV